MALASWALLTLDEAKDWLVIEGHAFDAVVERLIEATSLMVEEYTGRRLASRVYAEELYDGSGTKELVMREYPVTAVSGVNHLTSVSGSGVTWTAQTITNLVIADTVQSDLSRGRLFWRDNIFPLGKLNVQVSSTAGYTTIPEMLKEGMLMCMQRARQMQDKHLANVGGQGFPGGGYVRYLKVDIPEEAKPYLLPYRSYRGAA